MHLERDRMNPDKDFSILQSRDRGLYDLKSIHACELELESTSPFA